MRSIGKVLAEVKAQVKSVEEDGGSSGSGPLAEQLQQIMQNSLDMLRLINIAYPSETEEKTDAVDVSSFLLPPGSIDSSGEVSDDEDAGGDSDDDDDDDDDDVKVSLAKKRSRYSQKRTQLADESKRKKKKVSHLSASGKLLEKTCHVKEFSRTWLLLFSLPMSKKQRRLALKHLPSHVTPFLLQPLLLADYLIETVGAEGGVVGILALESLFQIIVLHNLDYPHFFEALYRMCSAEVFSAKYRSKFTTLLHTSLKSTNLPAYTVAAFIKRLSTLAIKIPGPSASFCLAQGVLLLRDHPQCHKLIHNSTQAGSQEVYDGEVNDTSQSHAFSSSLYEAVLLQQHYIPEIALMAKSLQKDADCTVSTQVSRKNVTFDIKKLMTHNYQSLIEDSLKGSKGSAPLAFLPPQGLFSQENIIGKCFGT
jgi:U3 small nucleolar RNA-associated protein 19